MPRLIACHQQVGFLQEDKFFKSVLHCVESFFVDNNICSLICVEVCFLFLPWLVIDCVLLLLFIIYVALRMQSIVAVMYIEYFQFPSI
jgi:hypothetical protein